MFSESLEKRRHLLLVDRSDDLPVYGLEERATQVLVRPAVKYPPLEADVLSSDAVEELVKTPFLPAALRQSLGGRGDLQPGQLDVQLRCRERQLLPRSTNVGQTRVTFLEKRAQHFHQPFVFGRPVRAGDENIQIPNQSTLRVIVGNDQPGAANDVRSGLVLVDRIHHDVGLLPLGPASLPVVKGDAVIATAIALGDTENVEATVLADLGDGLGLPKDRDTAQVDVERQETLPLHC